MKLANVNLFARWAIAGAVAGIGIVGLNHAIGKQDAGNRPTRPSIRLDGLELRGNFAKGDNPTFDLEVVASNPSTTRKTLDTSVALQSREFVGNPISRTLSPKDFKTAVLESQRLKVSLEPAKSQTVTLHFRTRQPRNWKPTISFVAVVKDNAKEQFLATAMQKDSFAVTVSGPKMR